MAQHWEKLLFSTRGAINTSKSHWYILSWNWKQGKPSLSTIHNTPTSLSLTSGYNKHPSQIPRINHSVSYRTLGVYISPLGSQLKQFKILCSHSDQFFSKVSTSSFIPDEAYWLYMLYLRPRLTYPLPYTSLAKKKKQCRTIQAPALAVLLPKLHLNHHTPHAVIFGDQKYSGLALPDLYTDQGFQQLKFLIGHINLRDDTRNLIPIAMSYLQLLISMHKPFFFLPFSKYLKWMDSWWLISIWKYTDHLKIMVDVVNH
jgi:hypothetical protein